VAIADNSLNNLLPSEVFKLMVTDCFAGVSRRQGAPSIFHWWQIGAKRARQISYFGFSMFDDIPRPTNAN